MSVVELNPETIQGVDKLALSNTITLSALVALLVKKGLLTQEELTEEVRRLKSRIGGEGQGT
jgi:hypothetical protein